VLLTIDFEGGLHCGHVEVDLSVDARDVIDRFGIHSAEVAAEMALCAARRGAIEFIATTPGHPTGQRYAIIEFDDDLVAPYIRCMILPFRAIAHRPVHIVADFDGGDLDGRAEADIPYPAGFRRWNDDGTVTRESAVIDAYIAAEYRDENKAGVGVRFVVSLREHETGRVYYEITRFESGPSTAFIACRHVSGLDADDD